MTKVCKDCGSSENLTKHHIFGKNNKNEELHYTNHLQVTLCRDCHAKKHGNIEKTNTTSLKRRLRRAKGRIKRDTIIIKETTKLLNELGSKG